MILVRLADGARLEGRVVEQQQGAPVLFVRGFAIGTLQADEYAAAEITDEEAAQLTRAKYHMRRTVSVYKVLPGYAGFCHTMGDGSEDEIHADGPLDTTIQLTFEPSIDPHGTLGLLTIQNEARAGDTDREPPISQVVLIDSLEQLHQLIDALREAAEELERAGIPR